MKAEYFLDLRLMKGKEVYKGKEVRVPVQNQAESYQGRRWRVTTAVRLSSPAGAPDPNMPLYIKAWGCWQCSHRPMKKKPFPAKFVLSSNEKGGSTSRLLSPQSS